MARKRWTVLAYLAGETDLAESMVISLKEMYRVGTTSSCAVVVQYNPSDAPPQRFTMRGGRSRPERDGCLGRVGDAVAVERLPRADLADFRPPEIDIHRAVLESFVEWGIAENPSDHYLVIVSGHGSGAVGRRIDQEGFSPGAVRTVDLGPTFASIRRKTGRMVDVLGLDACFMGMAEVCWELRSAARFLVASEGLTPQYGWPYHRILELFRDDDARDPRNVATGIVSKYLRYRADFDLVGQSVDLSACELVKTEPLAVAFERLRHTMELRLRDPVFRDALILAHWKAQSYKSEQYVDVWDFCHLLEMHSPDHDVRAACRNVRDAVTSTVTKSIYNGPAYQHSHGLSIYFPWSSVSPAYGQFGFAKATGWYRFLTRYVSATRREIRGASRRALAEMKRFDETVHRQVRAGRL